MEMRDRIVLDAMLDYGGGFIQALAEAAEKADAVNLGRIKEAFRREWDEYAEMAQLETREAP